MRSRTGLAAMVVVFAITLAACSSSALPAARDSPAPDVANSSPWPKEGMTGFYMVSEEITEYCPNGERYVGGTQIAEVIPPDAFDALDGYACVFTAPASGAPDEVDEIAYHLDSGLADLVRAYAATTDYVDGDCPHPVDDIYPHVRIEYEDIGYTVRAGGCRDSPTLDEALAALLVTEVARDTVTFAEYQESGL